jgi:hypothetical protein
LVVNLTTIAADKENLDPQKQQLKPGYSEGGFAGFLKCGEFENVEESKTLWVKESVKTLLVKM